MPGAMSPESLAGLLLLLAAAGLLAGFLSGLLGIGGGGVLVPVLYEVFGAVGVPEDVRMHVTLGTTLGVIAPTVLRSFAAFRARGTVDMDVVRRMGPWVFLGVTVGVLIASSASSVALRWVWVVFGTFLTIKMALGRDDWQISNTLPGPPWLEAGGFLIGILSTLMGIGGATFMVPLLTLHGRPLLQAVATATGIGPIIAIPGIIGYIVSGLGRAGPAAVVARLCQSWGLPNCAVGGLRGAVRRPDGARHLEARPRIGIRRLHRLRRRAVSVDAIGLIVCASSRRRHAPQTAIF